ncbi:ThuA domain-containing protein [Candidatus Poribacteria bacterium]|nr:ThuA domain-containing protein [Candidatus Poribacteria bacterium]
MTDILILTKTDQYHPSEALGVALMEWLKPYGSVRAEESHDKTVVTSDRLAQADILVTCVDWNAQAMTEEEGNALIRFVESGNTLVGIHGATAVSAERTRYIDLIGARVTHHSPYHEFPVVIRDKSHPITADMSDFKITDELYCMDRPIAGGTVLATAHWADKDEPMLYVRSQGKGKVIYNALGHDMKAYDNPAFRAFVLRSIEWAMNK